MHENYQKRVSNNSNGIKAKFFISALKTNKHKDPQINIEMFEIFKRLTSRFYSKNLSF